MKYSIEQARKLLAGAGLFYGIDDEDDPDEMAQTLNMNDVWAWASAEGEYVPDDKLPGLADLFRRYGWAGILYWVSEKNDGLRSEFHDNNRFIDFVRHEETLRKEVPDSNTRGYIKISYTLS